MMLFIVFMALSYGILGFVSNPLVALRLSFVCSFMSGFISVNIALTLRLISASAMRGRVMALLTTLIGSLTPIDIGACGYIGDLVDRNIPLTYVS